MSFYRTYRPQVIDEIDNTAVRSQLSALLSKDRKELPHAYFFTGPKGTGKTTAARVIAKLFNCEKLNSSGPCGKCEQCRSIAHGNSMDVIEMDAASNRGIDEIRLLRDRINLSPTSSRYTVYILDEVHMLTTEAFNALLKTLEEPPPHAVFILATTDAHKVPATIKSRCLELNFHRATAEELVHALTRIVKAEKIDIDKQGLALIAENADGSFRDAVKLLEQLSFQKGPITQKEIIGALTLPEIRVVEQLIRHLSLSEAKEALNTIHACHEKGIDLKWLLTLLLTELERLLVNHAMGDSVPNWETTSLQKAIRLLSSAYEELRYSPIPQLPLELAIIEFCTVPVQPAPDVTKETIIPGTYASPVTQAPPALRQEEKPQKFAVSSVTGLLSLDKLVEHWPDVIAATKPYNHSVAGVLRSSRPKAVEGGIVTIEAFYKFHQEKLADMRTKQVLSDVFRKLFGEKVRVEIVLGKK